MRAVPVILLFLLVASPVTAQDYRFSVPSFDCTVWINRDRSLDITYEIVFECSWGAHPIDIVDIGFPTDNYDIGSMEASVSGVDVKRIVPSTWIDTGVEVHLGSETIYPGESALFMLSGRNPGMVFRDTETDDYASVRFTPTWFDGSLLTGSTDFTLRIVFPEGSHPDSVRYHEREFTSSYTDSLGRVVYVWEERRRVDGSWMVGVSFTGSLVQGPLRDRPRPPLFTGEEAARLVRWAVPILLAGLFTWAIVASVRKAGKRKVSYLPPKIGVEGSGIRRGLTAPLAAMLLEERLERVLVLILYGLLRKGALELSGAGSDTIVRKTGAGGHLRSYETRLLEILPEPGTGEKVPEDDIRKVFVEMVEDLREKMEGFSLEESRDYYRHVIRNAWEMVRKADSAEKAGRILADRFGWLFADEDFDDRLESLPDFAPAFFPVWFHNIGWARGASGAGALNLSQFCAQIAGTLESAAGSAVSSLSRLSASVTTVTNPVPVSTSSYRGGGGSCACACACAGCACACAGGGR